MSTQSAQGAAKTTMYLESLDGSSMSNSQIVQATNEAFSHHKRLDIGNSNNSRNTCHDISSNPNPLETPVNSRLQLKKRKKDFESARSVHAASDFNTDFLSGIFRDISQAEEENENGRSEIRDSIPNVDDQMSSGCITDDENSQTRKRAKTTGDFHSIRRSCKSFTCLPDLSAGSSQPERNRLRLGSQHISQRGTTFFKPATRTRRVSVESQKAYYIPNSASSETAVLDTTTIHTLVDKVLEESLIFPRLPPTVSESSCNSNNLTPTSVHAAQGQVTTSSSNVEGDMHQNNTYGWFVDMDLEEDSDRADVISAAQETCRASLDEDLSFKAFTAPKKTSELDEEVEWAKAADTVDDVLGDFF